MRVKDLYIFPALQLNLTVLFFIVLRRSDKEKSGLQADNEDLLNQIEALKKQKVLVAFTLDRYHKPA